MDLRKKDFNWFDRKYEQGGRLTLEDRSELFSQFFKGVGLAVPERFLGLVREAIRTYLFDLEKRGNYTPSSDVLCFGLITCLGPLVQLPREELQGYLVRYSKAIQSHGQRVAFKRNFDCTKTHSGDARSISY